MLSNDRHIYYTSAKEIIFFKSLSCVNITQKKDKGFQLKFNKRLSFTAP